ncbi:hypothetical protein [Gemmobacter sp. 24YEA27]|uniref:hypothetical protein n=1 Tax=Gemmobacter sp. 24YEA27 TaxID=3040672 RepID=UPI0024B39BA5|nr:hypothetical protein [Gemmobacter sp. 24YEA27]
MKKRAMIWAGAAFKKLGGCTLALWRWFRRLSIWWQAVLAIPLAGLILMMTLVGNMGLAAMGGAIALYAWLIGPALGLISVLFAKAFSIVWRDTWKPMLQRFWRRIRGA